MNMEKYYKFETSETKNPEHTFRDELMASLTFGTRWDLYPFRINKELDETDERKELIKKERRSVFIRLLKLLIAMGIAIAFWNIKQYGAINPLLILVSSIYAIYQLIFIPLSLVAPRVVVAFKEGEYPYLWISTWLHIIASLIWLATIIFFVGMLLFALLGLVTFQMSLDRAVIGLFGVVFGTIVFFYIGYAFSILAHFFEDEDSDRRFVYIKDEYGKIATRRRD